MKGSNNLSITSVRDFWALRDYQKPYRELDNLRKELVDVKTRNEIRINRYDAAKDTLALTVGQVEIKEGESVWDKMGIQL